MLESHLRRLFRGYAFRGVRRVIAATNWREKNAGSLRNISDDDIASSDVITISDDTGF